MHCIAVHMYVVPPHVHVVWVGWVVMPMNKKTSSYFMRTMSASRHREVERDNSLDQCSGGTPKAT